MKDWITVSTFSERNGRGQKPKSFGRKRERWLTNKSIDA